MVSGEVALHQAVDAHHLSPKSKVAAKRYKGVRMRSWGKWVSEIRIPNSRDKIWLGSYTTAEAAAKAYDVAAISLRGTSSSLNFPDSPPQIVPGSLTPRSIQATAAAAAALSNSKNSNASSDTTGNADKCEYSSSCSSGLVQGNEESSSLPVDQGASLDSFFDDLEPLEPLMGFQELSNQAICSLETSMESVGSTAIGNRLMELNPFELEFSCIQDLEGHGLVAISSPVTSLHRFDTDSGMCVVEQSLWSS